MCMFVFFMKVCVIAVVSRIPLLFEIILLSSSFLLAASSFFSFASAATQWVIVARFKHRGFVYGPRRDPYVSSAIY